MKRVFLGFGVVLLVLSMMNTTYAYTIDNLLAAPAGVTITSSIGGIIAKTHAGVTAYGVEGGHEAGELDGQSEWIMIAFDTPQFITQVQLAFLYPGSSAAPGPYGDIVNETAHISYNTDYANRPTPGQFWVQATGATTFSQSGVGTVSNLIPASLNNAGVWQIDGLFGDTAVNSIIFYTNPAHNLADGYKYSDFSILSVTTVVPLPGAVWLLGAGLVGLVGLRRRFVK